MITQFESLELSNYKQFSQHQKIDFSTVRRKNITLILGPNGTGKTNLIKAISWCLWSEPSSAESDGRGEQVISSHAIRTKQKSDMIEVSASMSAIEDGQTRHRVERTDSFMRFDASDNRPGNDGTLLPKETQINGFRATPTWSRVTHVIETQPSNQSKVQPQLYQSISRLVHPLLKPLVCVNLDSIGSPRDIQELISKAKACVCSTLPTDSSFQEFERCQSLAKAAVSIT